MSPPVKLQIIMLNSLAFVGNPLKRKSGEHEAFVSIIFKNTAYTPFLWRFVLYQIPGK